MEDQDDALELKDFVRKIIAVVIGILLVGGVISLSVGLNFSIVLFGLGAIVTTLGAYLAGPHTYQPKDPRSQQINPHEKLSTRILHNVRNSLPRYAFENILFFAGLVSIVLSMPFVCQIMF